jgi:hypothetical protein
MFNNELPLTSAQKRRRRAIEKKMQEALRELRDLAVEAGCSEPSLFYEVEGDIQTLPRTVSVKRGRWNSEIIAVKPEVLTQLQRSGWPGSNEESKSYLEGLVEDPLTAMKNGEPVEILVLHNAWNQASDINGEPLPVALYFYYISGGFTEGRYDLLKAAKILMKRKDVTLVPHGGEDRRYGRKEPDAPEDPETYIGNIPYYNSEPGHSRCIAFHWHPTVKDYRKVYAQAALTEPEPGTDALMKACFDLDIFKLRAGGAAYFDDYWKDRRYEKDSNGSDRYEDEEE